MCDHLYVLVEIQTPDRAEEIREASLEMVLLRVTYLDISYPSNEFVIAISVILLLLTCR